ncbi:hypothetical protein [uncultured Tessaracoccus sp.]|nr:hypothetical protein [uncultured Tessaracoccus sp.]
MAADGVGICIDELVVQERVYSLERGDTLVDFIMFVGEITHRRFSPA